MKRNAEGQKGGKGPAVFPSKHMSQIAANIGETHCDDLVTSPRAQTTFVLTISRQNELLQM